MYIPKLAVVLLILIILTACNPDSVSTPLPSTVPTATELLAEITPTTPTLPGAVEAVQQLIADRLDMDPQQVEVLQYEKVDWPDACLGVQNPEQICAQVITPGYQILIQVNEQVYEFHTDLSGDQIVEVKPIEAGEQEFRLDWLQETESQCISATFKRDVIEWGDCQGENQSAPYPNQQRQVDLSRFSSLFSSFTAETQLGTLVFTGPGLITATDSQQRMLAEWVQQVLNENQTDPVASDRLKLLVYSVEGGIAGRCEEVSIFLSGYAEVKSCKGPLSEKPGIVWLNNSELQTIYYWADQLRNFETQQTDLGTADTLTTKVLFLGSGEATATPIEQQSMANMAEEFLFQATYQVDPEKVEAARQALSAYLEMLIQGKYSEAAELYGSSYDILRSNNPTIPGDNFAGLIEAGCTLNGFVCNLSIKNEVSYAVIAPDTYRFSLELLNPDGSLFILGPCCGASEVESPPVSQFDFIVKETEQGYKVMTLPVYVP